MILSILGGAALLGVAGFLLWERHDMATARIWAALRQQRATEIRIAADWLDFDRDTMTYDVEYTDREGLRRSNCCKVDLRPGTDDEGLYWASPL
jgi:hypothetical protein